MKQETNAENENRKNEMVKLFIISLGEMLCSFLNENDHERIGALRSNINIMFDGYDAAMFQQAQSSRASCLMN
ncbi:MAG: hypothetical protein GX800_11365 [Clostridiaceae bacterium]|nr:hypothetical protein [Clostridiaceae bacterium]